MVLSEKLPHVNKEEEDSIRKLEIRMQQYEQEKDKARWRISQLEKEVCQYKEELEECKKRLCDADY